MVPLFYESYALSSYQGRSWSRQAVNEGHSAVLFTPDTSALACWAGPGWGELELSLSTKPTGIQGPTGNKARRSMQLVAGVGGSLVFWSILAQTKSALKSLQRVHGRKIYFIHKPYSVFLKIRNLSKMDLFGQSWRNGFCLYPTQAQGRKQLA